MDGSLEENIPKALIWATRYPRFSKIFWANLVTGLIAIGSMAAVHGTHNFYYTQSGFLNNNTISGNLTCTERLVSLWIKCDRPCNKSSYSCSGLTPGEGEVFITISRVFESVALAFAVFSVALSITGRIHRRLGELKSAMAASVASGLLCIVGAYLFVLDFRDHILEEDRDDANSYTIFFDQGPRFSFYLCIVGFATSFLSAQLNGTEWCWAINYFLD